MKYVMSDLHGCYEEYKEALALIHFSNEDELYILGDVLDRGAGGIRILQDMMMRSNVIPILGNHEYMAMTVLSRLSEEITEETADHYLTVEDMTNYFHWTSDGGDCTVKAYRSLTREEQTDILDYLAEFSLYEEVHVNGKDYILVHGGLEPFIPEKPLTEYELSELIFRAPNYEQMYYENKYLVTGHRPTLSLNEKLLQGKILKKNNHIAIDCGCVFGGNLAVYRLEDGKEWYIAKK